MALKGPRTGSYTNSPSARYNFNRLDASEFFTDPFFANNILLLSTVNTNGAQNNTFLDSSTNNLTITRNGNSTQGTFNPYNQPSSSGSAYFDGTGDYLDAANVDTNFGASANFTVEFWMYPTIINSAVKAIIDPRTSDASAHPLIWINTSNQLYYFTTNANRIVGTTTLTANTWYHVALVRNNGTTTLYLNGSVEGTPWADTVDYASSTTFRIAQRYASTAFNYGGFITDLRVVKGTAVYTGNFTPPISPLRTSGTSSIYSNSGNVNTTFAAANTSLLCNFTNAGITDATGLNVFETVNQANVSTTVAKYTRAIAFDGTDDYLVAPYNSAFNFGTGPFTIECWVYFRQFAANRMIFENYTSAATDGGYQFYYRTTGSSITFYGNGVVIAQSSFTGHVANTWYHVAAARDTSNNLRVFVDGTQYANVVYSSNLNIAASSRPVVGIQAVTSTNDLDGLIEDLRVTKGVARYTGNFTPPTRTLPRR